MANEKIDEPLSRTEATLASTWLDSQGIFVQGGWIGLWKMRPQEIANEYGVDYAQVIKAIRR